MTTTRAMRTAAAKRGDTGYLSLWSGTGVAALRSLSATELVAVLMRELADAAPASTAQRSCALHAPRSTSFTPSEIALVTLPLPYLGHV